MFACDTATNTHAEGRELRVQHPTFSGLNKIMLSVDWDLDSVAMVADPIDAFLWSFIFGSELETGMHYTVKRWHFL